MSDKEWANFFDEMDKKLGIEPYDETEACKEYRKSS